MKTEKIDERRTKFKELLFKLALSQMTLSSSKEKSDIYIELEAIYASDEAIDDFRHFYSDIFAVLSQIDKDPSLGNIEILTQNMDIVRQGYKALNKSTDGKKIDISKKINKLYDHINLEVARMNYFKTIQLRTQDELERVTCTLNDVKNKVADMESAIDKADRMQKEYITILGIFAAIVLAFTGGIAFSTSLLENIANASIYRVVLIAIGLGFILINIIYILVRFIMEISKKNSTIIEYPRYMKWLNGLCIVSTIIVILCWFFDVSRAAEIFQNWLY